MWRIDLRLVADNYFRPDGMTEPVSWEVISLCSEDSMCPEPQIGHVAVSLGSRRFIVYGGRNVHGHCMISGDTLYAFYHCIDVFLVMCVT